jgi:hypothetical protein
MDGKYEQRRMKNAFSILRIRNILRVYIAVLRLGALDLKLFDPEM